MTAALAAPARFGKVVTAMVTPFTQDGAVDARRAAELARWLVAHGSDGLVLTGTTGEAPTLDDEEKLSVWRAVRSAVDVPLLAGSGSNDTAHSVELSRRAAAEGVDGLLVVVPYYNRPPQSGIAAHMEAVAQAVDNAPVVLYDVPARTGRRMEVETIVRLARDVPNVVGIKDARMDIPATARIVAETPSDFDVYAGDDSTTLPALAVGASGVVGVATHWAGRLVAEMVAAVDKGDLVTARDINARLLDSYAAEAIETPTSAARAALATLNQPTGPTRLPLPPVGSELRQRMHEIVVALGVTP